MFTNFLALFNQVYNTTDGDIVDMLKGHRDTVYCLSYDYTGERAFIYE
jgi:hypothetical protein